MAYSPYAEKYSGYGRLRGSGAYMTLSGDRPAAGLTSLPPGVIAGPTGAVVVSSQVRDAMAALVSRGNGAVGTRHTVRRVPGGAVPPVGQVPLASTPGSAPARRTGQYGGLPSTVSMRAGTSRAVPNGKGFDMWSATVRYGLSGEWDNEEKAKSMMGKPKAPGEFYSNAPPYPLWDGNTWQHKRACELGQRGMEGACKRFGTPFGAPSAAPVDTGSALYRNALSSLKTFYDQVRNAQIDPKSPLPGELGTLSAPASDASTAEKSAWDDFSYMRGTSLPSARREGQILWDAAHYVAPTYTPPASTTPASTTTTTTTAIEPVNSGTVYYQQPAPVTTYVGPEMYPENPTMAPSQAGTQRINTPDQAAAAQAEAEKAAIAEAQGRKTKTGVGIGIVAAVGLGLFMFAKRKKRKAA